MPNSNGNGYCDESLRLIRAIRVIRGQKIAFQTTDVTDDTDRIANAIGGQNSMGNLIHKELSEAIIGCAMTVLNTLRPGLDLALLLNFRNAKLEWKRVLR